MTFLETAAYYTLLALLSAGIVWVSLPRNRRWWQ